MRRVLVSWPTILLIRSEDATVFGAECCAAQHGAPRLGEEWKELGAGCWLGALGPPGAPGSGNEDHDGLAGALLELHLDGAELPWMMLTMRSISLGATGRVRLCSLSRFMTGLQNSLHACSGGPEAWLAGSPLALGIPSAAFSLHPLWLLSSPCLLIFLQL